MQKLEDAKFSSVTYLWHAHKFSISDLGLRFYITALQIRLKQRLLLLSYASHQDAVYLINGVLLPGAGNLGATVIVGS